MVRLWEVFADTQELVSHAKAGIPRCLTAAQRDAFFLPPEPPQWCIELQKWPYHGGFSWKMFREPFDTIPGAIELHDRTTRCAAARRCL